MTLYFADESVTLHHGDALTVARTLDAGSVDCIVTSPPYFGLRSYLGDDHPDKAAEHGAEPDPRLFVERLVRLFRELRRVLADDGTLWLNLGDSYSSGNGVRQKQPPQTNSTTVNGVVIRTSRGTTPSDSRDNATSHEVSGMPSIKNLLGMPWRTALALQDDGWILRNDVIWSKPNTMPESVTDRLSTKHEHVFLLTKKPRYYFDLDAIREPAVTTRDDALSWDREEQGVPGQKPQHRPGRPQRARAEQIAREKGLTQAHLDAIRAAGVTDTGKATVVQTGAGKNTAEVQRLAAEAKAALGGYYREFLTPTGKNPGDVWEIATQPFPGAHFATMPVRLAERCIQAGCKPGGTVLDPFSGSGTTGLAAARHSRRYVGIDLNADYLDLSLRTRLQEPALDLGDAS